MFSKHSYAVFQYSCKHTTGHSPTFPPISQRLPTSCISNPVRVDVHQNLGKVRSQGCEKLKNIEARNFQCFVGSFWVGMKVTLKDNFCYVGLVDQLFSTTNMMLISTSRRVACNTNRRCRKFPRNGLTRANNGPELNFQSKLQMLI